MSLKEGAGCPGLLSEIGFREKERVVVGAVGLRESRSDFQGRYSKGAGVLRIAVVVHHTKELCCGRLRGNFPRMVELLRGMLERFLNTLPGVEVRCIADDTLEDLPRASRVGKSTVGGVDGHRPRRRALLRAVIALAPSPQGFTASEVAAKVRQTAGRGSVFIGTAAGRLRSQETARQESGGEDRIFPPLAGNSPGTARPDRFGAPEGQRGPALAGQQLPTQTRAETEPRHGPGATLRTTSGRHAGAVR